MPGINLAGANQSLDGSLPTIFSEFRLLRDETGVFRSMATEMPLRPHEGVSKRINNYNRVTAFSVADGVDINQQQSLADTTTSYTPGEVAVQVVLAGSTMRRIQDPDLLRRTGRMLSNAYDLKEDSDGAAQMPAFVPIVGSAGTVMSPGLAMAAISRVSIGNDRTNPEPAPEPWYLVLHPMSALPLAGRLMPLSNVPTGSNVYGTNTGAHAGVTLTNGGAGSIGDEILRRGIGALGTFFGATVKRSANIAVDGSDDASGAAFSKEALIFVEEIAPRLDPDDSDKSMRGAVELNLWGSYVWGLYRASNYGCEVLVDASLPTS